MDNPAQQMLDFLKDLLTRLQTISLASFTMFDLIVVMIFIALLAWGVWKGLVRQLATFVALVGGYLLAARYASELRPYTAQFFENPKIAFFAAFGIIFLLAAFLFTLAGYLLHKVTKLALLGWLDRFLGLLLGAVKAYLICAMMLMALASDGSPFQNTLKKSQTVNFLAPGAEMVKNFINDPKLSEKFDLKQGQSKDDQKPGSPPKQGRDPGPQPPQRQQPPPPGPRHQYH